MMILKIILYLKQALEKEFGNVRKLQNSKGKGGMNAVDTGIKEVKI